MTEKNTPIPPNVKKMAEMVCKDAQGTSFDIDKDGTIAVDYPRNPNAGIGIRADYAYRAACKNGKPDSIKPIEKPEKSR